MSRSYQNETRWLEEKMQADVQNERDDERAMDALGIGVGVFGVLSFIEVALGIHGIFLLREEFRSTVLTLSCVFAPLINAGVSFCAIRLLANSGAFE